MMRYIRHFIARLVYGLVNRLAKARRYREIAEERRLEENLVLRNFPVKLRSKLTQGEKKAFIEMWNWIGGGGVPIRN